MPAAAPAMAPTPEPERAFTTSEIAWIGDDPRASARVATAAAERTGAGEVGDAPRDPHPRAHDRGPGLLRVLLAGAILGVAAAGAVALFRPSLRPAPEPTRAHAVATNAANAPAPSSAPPAAVEAAPKAAVEPAVDSAPEAAPKAAVEPAVDSAPETAPKAAAEPAVDSAPGAAPKAAVEPAPNAAVDRVNAPTSGARASPPAALSAAEAVYAPGKAPPESAGVVAAQARFEPGTVKVARVRKKETHRLSQKDRRLLDLLGRKKDSAALPERIEALDLDTGRSLEPAAVERVVAESQGAFSGCIRRNARSGQDERATLLLTVDATGAVSYAWIAEAGLSTSGLGRCLATAGRRLVFPAFEGSSVNVSVPLLLEAR